MISYFATLEGIPPTHKVTNPFQHTIELLPGTSPSYEPVRRLSVPLLKELKEQLIQLQEKGFITPSCSPYGAPILFVKKKNGKLRLCIDYRKLNQQTIKNRYPLPRTDDLLDLLQGAHVFSTLDLASGYYQIPIAAKDRHKTAFRTRYGLYEFTVMPFGLCNAPATFQLMMNELFRPHLDDFVTIYLDDIIVFSKTEEEHHGHLCTVFNILQTNGLFLQKNKCSFFQRAITFLGFNISGQGIRPDSGLTQAIQMMPPPNCKKQLQSFLGSINFYRRFIKSFAHIAHPLHQLTTTGTIFQWRPEHQDAFDKLKTTLGSPPVLKLFDPKSQTLIFTDASGVAIGAVLMQRHAELLHPVAFLSRTLTNTEQRYATHDRELLAIYYALTRWKHYVHGLNPIVYTDHKPLTHIFNQKDISDRQARWLEKIQEVNPVIKYVQGADNSLADLLSRITPLSVISFATPTLTPDLMDRLRNAYNRDAILQDVLVYIRSGQPITSLYQHFRDPTKLTCSHGFIYYAHPTDAKRLVIPDDSAIKEELLQQLHDHPLAGHGGQRKTKHLATRNFYWPHMQADIDAYIRNCPVCQRVRSRNHKTYGLLQPLPVPEFPWEHISMDFITHLPETATGFSCLLVFVDRFSKMLHMVPTSISCDAEMTARLFFKEVVRLHGIPKSIVSDRDVRFVNSFWTELTKLLGTKALLSTAYHPQTDGQTERTNRTIEDILRAYCDSAQRTWDRLLAAAEFAYNNAYHSSTQQSPFYTNYGRHPHLPLHHSLPLVHTGVNHAATNFANEFHHIWRIAKANILLAQRRQARTADGHRRAHPFTAGMSVLLSTTGIKFEGQSSLKLSPKFLGPFTIKRMIGRNAAELDSQNQGFRFHPVVHVDRLRPYHSNTNISSLDAEFQRQYADVALA